MLFPVDLDDDTGPARTFNREIDAPIHSTSFHHCPERALRFEKHRHRTQYIRCHLSEKDMLLSAIFTLRPTTIRIGQCGIWLCTWIEWQVSALNVRLPFLRREIYEACLEVDSPSLDFLGNESGTSFDRIH